MKISNVIALSIVFHTVYGKTLFSGELYDLELNFSKTPDQSKPLNESVEDKVSFHLYTKENLDGQEITISENSLKSSTFNTNRSTKIIVHGFRKSKNSASVVEPRDALLTHGDYNIIVVDWSKTHVPGGYYFYTKACEWVPNVGGYLAKLIDFLENYGMDLTTMTLIGHSLGAHVVGIAGYKTKNKVNIIIGLDPAGPRFEKNEPSNRLSKEAAKTVIALHTNTKFCGIKQQVGHYDFYPNGGKKQPGCLINSCSHARAYKLYAESVSSDIGFYAQYCSNVEEASEENCAGSEVIVNENLRKQNAKEGMYYFKTNKSRPFALDT